MRGNSLPVRETDEAVEGAADTPPVVASVLLGGPAAGRVACALQRGPFQVTSSGRALRLIKRPESPASGDGVCGAGHV